MVSLEPEGLGSGTDTENTLNIGCLYSETDEECCLENKGSIEKGNSDSLNTTYLAT